MLITNCLSSQRIKIVINPGWDKFIAIYHINAPVWPSNKCFTFLRSIIKKVIQPIIKLEQSFQFCKGAIDFIAAQKKKHFSQKKILETLICKEISCDGRIHAGLAKFPSKQCILIGNFCVGEILLCIACGLHSKKQESKPGKKKVYKNCNLLMWTQLCGQVYS